MLAGVLPGRRHGSYFFFRRAGPDSIPWYIGIVCGEQLDLQLEQGCPEKLGSALGPNLGTGKSRDYLP